MCEAPIALRGRVLREGNIRCEGPADEGCVLKSNFEDKNENVIFQ